MGYPKNTINTGLALELVASDTLPIPHPSLQKLSGTATGVAPTLNSLVDTAGDFIVGKEGSGPVQPGDVVYNTTAMTSASVVSITSDTVIVLDADIFGTLAFNDNYKIFLIADLQGLAPSESQGCLLYVGSNSATRTYANGFVDLKVKTSAGSIVTFSSFPVGEYLPIQVLQLYSTGTDTTAAKNCIAIW